MAENQEEKKPELRDITDEELWEILQKHELWLISGEKDGQRANLSSTNLENKTFTNANLRNANLHNSMLQGANLQGADLRNANLSNAVLDGASLRGANFANAYLRNSTLRHADLQNAALYKADLTDAAMGESLLQNAKLGGASLEGAGLQYADLEGAVIEKANLHNASLIGVKNLHTANLHDCNFEGATGLTGTEFARADITGARLPEGIREFKMLGIVAETSQNAVKIFIATILACVYSWLTIGSTTDVALLTNSSATPLPIIQTAIPIATFYLVAPVLLLALYFYLHFYLQRLWTALGTLPAIFEDGRPLDQRAYPWPLNGLVRRHFEKLQVVRPLMIRLEEYAVIVLAWWLVPITLCWFWLRYIPRRDWMGTDIHLALIIISIAAGVYFYHLHAQTLRGGKRKPLRLKNAWRDKRAYQFAFVIVVSAFAIWLSLNSINVNSRDEFILLREIGYNVFADFWEKDVSTRPDNYWLIELAYRDSSVAGARLTRADLRFAIATRAFLLNADLRLSNLSGAFLNFAQLQRTKLELAILDSASLEHASLEGADLGWVSLRGTKLGDANLDSAILIHAWLKGADLSSAKLRGANLQYAHLGSSTQRANLSSADLGGANLDSANLWLCLLRGANLSGATLRGANLSEVSGLTQEQLDAACGDSLTILPPGLHIKPCPKKRR